tara:strand:- start:34 stop:1155 length:1122 start_codon:yes stop_codon:yes gene_type:complete
MGYTASPLVIKKYIKIPDRRLISGFLTINCISHYDNDANDDANEYFYTNWGDAEVPAKIQQTRPWNNTQSADFGRTGYKHTFGDYDCLLFWVAGGMTLQTPVMTGSDINQSTLAGQNFVHGASGGTTWEDDAGSPNDDYVDAENWYSGVTHPCQHFMKSHLIGRINNGYGHTSGDYEKINGILTNTFEMSDNTAGSLDDNITTAPGTAYDDSGSFTEANEETNHNANRAGYASARRGKWARYISSNGTYSNDTDGDFIVDLSTESNNTYFPMIENVEIYGKHDFTIPTHFSTNVDGAGTDGLIYTNGNTTVGNYSHQDDFWSMVIKISYRAYADNYPSDAIGSHEFFQSRTNVSFQPFGETGSFDVSDSFHTS